MRVGKFNERAAGLGLKEALFSGRLRHFSRGARCRWQTGSTLGQSQSRPAHQVGCSIT
jgi:hypothetical protein